MGAAGGSELALVLGEMAGEEGDARRRRRWPVRSAWPGFSRLALEVARWEIDGPGCCLVPWEMAGELGRRPACCYGWRPDGLLLQRLTNVREESHFRERDEW